MAIGKILTGAGGLVSPFMDAFGIGDSGEDAYERFLRQRGISKADIRSDLSDQAGIVADRAELAKGNLLGNLESQGLGNSIIGAQAGLKADMDKNKFIAQRMAQLYGDRRNQQMKNEQDLADFKLGRAGARRQGVADLLGGGLTTAGYLFDWMKKRKQQ